MSCQIYLVIFLFYFVAKKVPFGSSIKRNWLVGLHFCEICVTFRISEDKFKKPESLNVYILYLFAFLPDDYRIDICL